MNTFKKNGGFTLVELIIVIAILAILSAVAVAGYSTYIKRANDSAILSELTNISTSATLANAEAGGIESIVVAADGKFTIKANSTFANEFEKLFEESCGIDLEPVKSGDKITAYTGEVTSKSWPNADKYKAGAHWNGTWNEGQPATTPAPSESKPAA